MIVQDFHGRYYHPSNARFWFYGDDEPEERLRLLGSYLDEFEARPVDSTVHLQPLLKVLPAVLMHVLCSITMANSTLPWVIFSRDCIHCGLFIQAVQMLIAAVKRKRLVIHDKICSVQMQIGHLQALHAQQRQAHPIFSCSAPWCNLLQRKR